MDINYSRPDTHYRIQIELSLALGTDIDLARKVIIDAVKEVDGVLPDRKVEALFLQFGTSGLVFRVRWWADSFYDTRRMFDRVNSAIDAALNDAGIKLDNPGVDTFHYIDKQELSKVNKVIRGQV